MTTLSAVLLLLAAPISSSKYLILFFNSGPWHNLKRTEDALAVLQTSLLLRDLKNKLLGTQLISAFTAVLGDSIML